MNEDGPVHYIDTETASVTMTGGVPFKVGEQLESDSEDEDEALLLSTKDENRCLLQDSCLESRMTALNSDGSRNITSTQKTDSGESIVSSSLMQTRDKSSKIAEIDLSPSSKSRSTLIDQSDEDMNNIDEFDSKFSYSSANQAPIDQSASRYPESENSDSDDNSSVHILRKKSDFFNNAAPQDIPAHMLINSDREYRLRTNHRFNPFNQIPMIDEDHYSEHYFNPRSGSYGSSSPRSSFQNVGGVPPPEPNPSDVTFAELGLAEDHFSHPQGHFGLSGVEELELAIDNCKDMIREAEQGSEKQKNLVMKLVQLRKKLLEIKEEPEPVPDDVKIILSHKMIPKSSRTSKFYCERCNGVIWGMLQYWYRCSECGYRCHEKCLQQILRTCAKTKVLENQPLLMEICPKDSTDLASQTYRCAECRSAISFKPGHSEPRLCDYSGKYFCEYCHWNDLVVIPARVLHNWDFTVRKVARSSKQFLRLMVHKPVIRIQDINPMLFVIVDQLNEIKKLREEMMVMKKYIISCPSAMAAKLLLLLEKRQHFVESSDRYSMQDLLDAEEILLPELVNIHSTWAQHIKVDCELCQGRGFCCELCNDKDILFPFDNIAVVCAKCSNVLHRHCFAKKSVCPRCERRERRVTPKSE